MSASDRPPKKRADVRPLRRHSAAEDVPVAPKQLDLFPQKPVIDVLDPRQVVGGATTVQHLVRVRMHAKDTPHLVFHDRHGWYCESHGATCATVAMAREAVR